MGALRFDGFTLDLSPLTLTRGGRQIPLRPQCLKVLAYLAERSGEVISNDDLIKNCWDEGRQRETHVNSVAQCIKEIREALGESEKPIIRTVPRQGYRFAASVSDTWEADPTSTPEKPLLDASPAIEWRPGLLSGLGWKQVALAGVLVLGAAAVAWTLGGRPGELTMMARPSIVVLPVRPLGDETDAAVAALADEIAGGVLHAPSGFAPDIRPSKAVKGEPGDPRMIGQQLAVRYVVHCRARREGDVLYLNVELIEAESAREVWIGSFEYRPGDGRAQSHVAARIGRTLAAEILRAEVHRPLPARPGAAHFTMLGRSLLADEANAKARAKAIVYFRKAIEAEPKNVYSLTMYARAIAGGILAGWVPAAGVDESLAKAEEAIRLALTLKPNGAGAHLTYGTVLRAHGEHEQAIKAFRQSLKHNPNFANAYAELGRTQIDVDRPEEGLKYIKKAIDLSPTDFAVDTWLYWGGLAHLHLGDPERALEWFQEARAANRAHDNPLRMMAVALDRLGRKGEALEMVKKALQMRSDATVDDWTRPSSGRYPAVDARRADIRATLKALGMPEGKRLAGP
jgi:DNA-binding winged helix-turn-helix (wHTH) protein/tetratricopeptide (TPR) repeat protein/TolB-like protein